MEKNPNLENLNFDFSFFPAHNMNLHPPTPPVQRESNNITVQQSIHIKNIEIVYSGYDLAHIPIYIPSSLSKKKSNYTRQDHQLAATMPFQFAPTTHEKKCMHKKYCKSKQFFLAQFLLFSLCNISLPGHGRLWCNFGVTHDDA